MALLAVLALELRDLPQLTEDRFPMLVAVSTATWCTHREPDVLRCQLRDDVMQIATVSSEAVEAVHNKGVVLAHPVDAFIDRSAIITRRLDDAFFGKDLRMLPWRATQAGSRD